MSNYTNSDIFNAYIKIAEDQNSEDSKKALDKNPRADSLTKERIEKLYNVKNNTPKDMQYKRNIIEDAHPKPYVVGPAYDRLNALVENNNERQNIMLRIVNKRTNGLLTQHKYAQDELARTLVRIANDLDNKNEEELRSLADDCLSSLKKKAGIVDWLIGSDVPDVAKPLLSALRGETISIPLAIALSFVPGLGLPLKAALSAGAYAGPVIGSVYSYFRGMKKAATKISTDGAEAIDDITKVKNELTNAKNVSFLNSLTECIEELVAASRLYLESSEEISRSKASATEAELHASQFKQHKDEITKLIVNFEKLYKEYKETYHASVHAEYDSKSPTLSRIRQYISVMERIFDPVEVMKQSLETLDESVQICKKVNKIHTGKIESGVAEFKDRVRSLFEDEGENEEGEDQGEGADEIEGGLNPVTPPAQKAAYHKSLVKLIKSV